MVGPGNVDGRLFLLVLQLWVGALLDQQPHDLELLVLCREMDGRVPLSFLRSANIYCLCVSQVPVLRVQLEPIDRQQVLDGLGIAVLRTVTNLLIANTWKSQNAQVVQDCVAQAVLAIDVDPGIVLDRLLCDLKVVALGRALQHLHYGGVNMTTFRDCAQKTRGTAGVERTRKRERDRERQME